jgi:Zn-dependent metalloprotease
VPVSPGGGIGRDKAEKIWYRTLTTYLTSRSDYAAARAGSIQAATDLYGAGSAEVQATADAWKAVNVL